MFFLEVFYLNITQNFIRFKTVYIITIYTSDIYDFIYMYLNLFLDSNLYAHFVFKAFDVKSNGAISFKVSFVLYMLYNNIYCKC